MKPDKLKKYSLYILLLFSAVALAGPGPSKMAEKPKPKLINGIPIAQDDFYSHVNDPWLDSLYNFSDEEVETCDANQEALKRYNSLVDTCLTTMVDARNNNKVKATYDSLIDNNGEATINSGKITKNIMDIIDSSSPFGAGGYLDKFGLQSIANIEIRLDKDSQKGQVYLMQSEKQDIPSDTKTIQDILNIADKSLADKILKLEHDMHRSETGFVNFKEYKINKLPKAWQDYLEAVGISGRTDSIMIDNIFYNKINELSIKPELWKWYFKFHFTYTFRRVFLLSKQQNIEFKRPLAFEQIKLSFGNELNRLCFDKYINENERNINEIFNNIKTAYLNGIKSSVWMETVRTKQIMTDKIINMRIAIAYPDYDSSGNSRYTLIGSGDTIKPNDPLGNIMRINEQYYQHFINKINEILPLSYVSWSQNSLDDNPSPAYLPRQNALIVPITELSVPFFNPNNDKSFNYGGIGFTIGHEISHASDVSHLQQFDQKTGRYIEFATSKEIDNINAIGQQLRLQYTLGGYQAGSIPEDIADNRGLEKAYEAYLISLNGEPVPTINNNMKGDQYLYYNYAKTWQSANYHRCNDRLHAAPITRTNATLKNQPGFYKAYDVKPSNLMYVDPQVRTW